MLGNVMILIGLSLLRALTLDGRLTATNGHCRSTTASVELSLLLRMRRPRPGGDKQQLWPGTQSLYSVHTAQEPNDRYPQKRSVVLS